MRIASAFLFCMALLVLMSPPQSWAQEGEQPVHHEDPDVVKTIYSNMALMRYYAGSLDLILQGDWEGIKINLGKLPLANLPDALAESAETFRSSGIKLTGSMEELEAMWEKGKILASQYRLEEARDLYFQAKGKLPQFIQELNRLESSLTATADFMKITGLPSSNNLQMTYQEIIGKINQIREMPELFEKIIEELAGRGFPNDNKELPFKKTEVTLVVSQEPVFVGDEVYFEGLLSSGEQQLGAREIEILLNSDVYVKAVTDGLGRYRGLLKLPYQYISEVGLQALYVPQGGDAGIYRAGLSDEAKVKLKYYEGKLTLTGDIKAYPGKTTSITGKFEYQLVSGENKTPQDLAAAGDGYNRTVELYLDDSLCGRYATEAGFTQSVDISPDAVIKRHVVSAFAGGNGRLAPVTGEYGLEVVKAAVNMELEAPVLTWIPGSFDLRGRLWSELGPLENAMVKVDGMNTTVATEDDFENPPGSILITEGEYNGEFKKTVKAGMGWSLLGIMTLNIQVEPQEPWNAPVTVNKNIFMINFINTGAILAALALMGLILSRRLGKWYAARQGLTVQPRMMVKQAVQPAAVLLRSDQDAAPGQNEAWETLPKKAHRYTVLYWYQVALELVQRITGLVFRPNQTLREYDRESSRKLGATAGYFHNLIMLVEKVLYSRYKSRLEDEEKAREMVEGIGSVSRDKPPPGHQK
jgi:hypothetical protein